MDCERQEGAAAVAAGRAAVPYRRRKKPLRGRGAPVGAMCPIVLGLPQQRSSDHGHRGPGLVGLSRRDPLRRKPRAAAASGRISPQLVRGRLSCGFAGWRWAKFARMPGAGLLSSGVMVANLRACGWALIGISVVASVMGVSSLDQDASSGASAHNTADSRTDPAGPTPALPVAAPPAPQASPEALMPLPGARSLDEVPVPPVPEALPPPAPVAEQISPRPMTARAPTRAPVLAEKSPRRQAPASTRTTHVSSPEAGSIAPRPAPELRRAPASPQDDSPPPAASVPTRSESSGPTMGPVVVYEMPQGGTKTFRSWHASDGTTMLVPTGQTPPTD